MIVKSKEAFNLKLNNNFYLFYGKNDGLKSEIIYKLLKDKKEIYNYEEKEIIDNSNNFIENILNKSLFETQKIIVIKRSTEKLFKFIEELKTKEIDDIVLIINSENLDKKSKLRSLFEKDKKYICVAVYPDNEDTLSRIAYNFFKNKKILISAENINLIVSRSNESRHHLNNELTKIENFSKNIKKISNENILKLINLSENYSVENLINNCLAKNQKKTIQILNENNYTKDDCIQIIRMFLNKSKRLFGLSENFSDNNDINLTLTKAKPPIFWKDKEITKQQILKRNPDNIKRLIFKLNEIELLIKKDLYNPVNILTDFIIEQSSITSNNEV